MSIKLNKLGFTTMAMFALMSLLGSRSVKAASFTFSYLFESGALLSGSIEGEIQSDSNTITELSNISATLTDDIEGDQTWSSDIFSSDSLSEPTISLDGTIMDWGAGSDEGGAFFLRNGIITSIGVLPFGAAAGGSVDASFNVLNWSIQAQDEVPIENPTENRAENPITVPEPVSILGILLFGGLNLALKLKS
ncbi:hypothetical protein [Crocosphaera sp. Alani8]|uniref:hypothetical protein n=1 Tax=Crocosphaera sp. Alani8 TaxID=3038952 RepID=UPI00313F23F8